MNSQKLYVEKFSQLIDLAQISTTDFEKASVFAAVMAIAREFNEANVDPYALEKVEQVRWHTCASIGYDVDNGHNADQHISWASGALETLKSLVKDN